MLGLLAIGPASGYQLAQQMERSLRVVWPRAESRLYEEPKKLVAHGLAKAQTEAGGRRRTVYTITAKGRRALRRWLAEPGAAPVVEFEGLLKLLYADHAGRDDVLATIDRVVSEAEARIAIGDALAREYVEGRGPYPDRVHVNALVWEYLRRHHETVLGWARWAREVVSGWDGTTIDERKRVAALRTYRAGLR